MPGFLRAQRDRFKHRLFRREKFCRGYAWDWLVAQAAFKPHEIDLNGKTVILARGQLCHSIRYIADIWGWDKAAVSRFLTRLKSEDMIETQTDTGQTVITICKYDQYQSDQTATETPAETPTETAARQQRDSSETKKKEGKRREKNEKESGGSQLDLLGDKTSKPDPINDLVAILGTDLCQDFIAHRKSIKKPLSEVAAKRLVPQLRAMRDPRAAVNRSIVNGYQGVFEDGNKPDRRSPDSSIDALLNYGKENQQ